MTAIGERVLATGLSLQEGRDGNVLALIKARILDGSSLEAGSSLSKMEIMTLEPSDLAKAQELLIPTSEPDFQRLLRGTGEIENRLQIL